MDLNKEDPKRIASLIFNGKLALDEVPKRRRSTVAACIEELKQKADAKLESLEHEEIATKAEIMEKLDALDIEYTKSAKKADLFALLPT